MQVQMLVSIVLTLLSFCLFLPKYNAINSISSVLAILIILYVYKGNLIAHMKRIPTELKTGFIVFLCSLIIASVGLNDKECIRKAFDYVYYTAP